MSEKMLIGIALFPPERTNVDISELATMKIYQTPGGGYFFVDRKVIDTALVEILEAKDRSAETMVFIALEVFEVSERRRRTRREGAR